MTRNVPRHGTTKALISSGPELTSATLYLQTTCVDSISFPCSSLVHMICPMIQTGKLRPKWWAPDHTQGRQAWNLSPAIEIVPLTPLV